MKITKRALQIEESLTLAITAKAKAMKEAGRAVIGFGAGEPDFNTPQFIINAAVTAMEKGMTKYTPSSGTLSLRQAVCDKFLNDNGLDYKPNQIIISNGAKQSLYNVMLALVEEGDEVIIPAPFWLTYPELVSLCGGKNVIVKTFEKEGFKLTPESLLKAVTKKTKLLILNSPSNPSGVVYSKAELEALGEVIEKTGIYCVSDEVYETLVYGGEKHYSIASVCPAIKDKVIVVNAVSKAYAMTGWRIGYLAAEREIAKAIDNIQSHTTSNPNSIAQYAAQIALTAQEGKEFIDKAQKVFEERRQLIMNALNAEGLKYITPAGAFYVMVKVSDYFGKTLGGKLISSAQDFADALLDTEAVAAVPCESFGASEHIRISYALSEKDISEGVKRIGRFVKQ